MAERPQGNAPRRLFERLKLARLGAMLSGVRSQLARFVSPRVLLRPLSALSRLPGQAWTWLSSHPRVRAAFAGVALAIVVAVATVTVHGLLPERKVVVAPVHRLTLADAINALDERDYPRARQLAAKLRSAGDAAPGGISYVLGAAAAYEADEYLGRERKNLFLLAANHLQDARELGFPEEQRGEGLFLLGKSLSLSGKYVESRAPLEEALTLDPTHGRQIHWLLAAAYSKGADRDVPRALKQIEAYLADENLELADRYEGQLEQLRMLYQQHDVAGCEAVLAKIPREATVYPDAELIRGRLAMQEAAARKQELMQSPTDNKKLAVKQAYEKAIEILRHAQDDPLGSQAIRRSMYLIGVCFLEMEDYPAALVQFERARRVWLDTPEGLAAALQEADLQRRRGQKEDAAVAYLRLLAAVREPFANAWIPPDQFRGRILDAFRQYLIDHDYEKAVALTESMAPLFAPARAAEYQAEALRTWSAKLLADSEKLDEPEATNMRGHSRALARRAGRQFARLAELEFTTRNFSDDLWRSGECYLIGHDFRAAAATFEEYSKHETRKRRPAALINMGECYLALKRLDEALAACQECIEFYPTDAASYQARIITSKVYVEKGEMAAAEAVLRENLNGDLLAPESLEWRDSLFRLGELLQADGRYEEAIQRLREAVERYPDTAQAVRARYLIAESYRLMAKGYQEKLLKDTIETTRLAHQKELQRLLGLAVEYYGHVQESLNHRQERTRLTPLEKAMLRNSYFAVGAAWFDLQKYENAIRAYSTVINRYQHDPEALEAFVQIANCYRRWNKTAEARGTIQQAKLVLNRMDAQAPFSEVTNNTRREWVDLLDWLATF